MGTGDFRLRTSVLGFAFFLLASLSAGVATAAPEAKSQVLNIGNGAEPKDLDPQIVTGVPESNITQNLFEALVCKDPKTLQPIPAVAESWTISKDGKIYTFKLRNNAKWTNGDPVTASDFVYSWIRLLNPLTAAEYAYQGYYLKNGEAFNKGTLKDPSQVGVKAIDPHTLQVTLENPTPFFLSLVYHQSLLPVHKATVEKFGAKWTRPENIVSNGAYMLDKWEMNKIISLKPNPKYWDLASLKLTRVNYYPVEQLQTEEKMFRAKELQITYQVPLEKIPFWQKDSTGVYQQAPYLGTYFYWVNVKKAPLDNKLVRTALALGIDRERIVKYVTRAGELPGSALTPPGTGGYEPTPRLPIDGRRIKEAQALLAKAGYPGGKGLPPIDILYNTAENHKKIAEALQEMWKKNLGVDVRLFNQEWKVYLDSMHSKAYQIARQGWIGDYNDPNTFLDMFMSDNGNNNSNWANPAYDKLLRAAAKEQDKKKRLADFSAAEDILLDELPVIPVYIYTKVFLKATSVQGWFSNIEDIHPLKFVSLGSPSGIGRK
jgi:oligopeptide transport system substrate-binding protein